MPHRSGSAARPAITTLAVDIGGTGIKAMLLDAKGRPVSERLRIETPEPSAPRAVLAVIRQLASELGTFHRVSVGFPGVVVRGVVKTAPNLGTAPWAGVNLEREVERVTRRDSRICNDADMQGYGAIAGKGVELVLTLGTGLGSGLFLEGHLVPNLELGHHPFRKGKTYEEALGQRALDRIGRKRWRRRMLEAIAVIEPVFNYHRLYLGGGNARLLEGVRLPPAVRVVNNVAGLLGGIALWDESVVGRRRRT